MQAFFGTPEDGIISGQMKGLAKYYPALKAVSFSGATSSCVKKLQTWLGITADGIWGKATSKALQKKLGVTVDGIFGTASMKAWQRYQNEHDKAETEKPKDIPPTKKTYKVIDVSEWQGAIDWVKVKASGISGAIIRYADGDYLDKCFDKNMTAAKAAGLHVGAYIFSRAKTSSAAEREAERLYNACKKYNCDMPLYIDLEDNSCKNYANTVAAAFLNKMKTYGATAGVYANLTWWNNYLTKVNCIRWIAQYNDKCTYKGSYDMWQYSSSGKVSGISGRVDMDVLYRAYWTEEPAKPATKKTYEGEYPNVKVVINGPAAVAKRAEEYCYPVLGKKERSQTLWPTGKPTDAYKAALASLPAKSHSWCQAARDGANCDVAVWTVVRTAGIDKNFPAGLWKQLKYMQDHGWKQVKASEAQPGDVGFYIKDVEGDHGHIFIIGPKNLIWEASHNSYYPRTNKGKKSHLSMKGKRKLYIFRPPNITRDYLKTGDSGEEVKKLQAYLNWYKPENKLAVDGSFGPATESAAKALQKDLYLNVDGLVGQTTLGAMKTVKR